MSPVTGLGSQKKKKNVGILTCVCQCCSSRGVFTGIGADMVKMLLG